MNDFTPFEYLQPLPSPDKLPLLRRFDHKSLRDFISEVSDFYEKGGSMAIVDILQSGTYKGAYEALGDAWEDTFTIRNILSGPKSPRYILPGLKSPVDFFYRETTLFEYICEAYLKYQNAAIFIPFDVLTSGIPSQSIGYNKSWPEVEEGPSLPPKNVVVYIPRRSCCV